MLSQSTWWSALATTRACQLPDLSRTDSDRLSHVRYPGPLRCLRASDARCEHLAWLRSRPVVLGLGHWQPGPLWASRPMGPDRSYNGPSSFRVLLVDSLTSCFAASAPVGSGSLIQWRESESLAGCAGLHRATPVRESESLRLRPTRCP